MESRKWFIATLLTMLAVSYIGGLLAYRFVLWAGL
jgi:hypothetical protein